jgi:hypothetical protein
VHSRAIVYRFYAPLCEHSSSFIAQICGVVPRPTTSSSTTKPI